MRFDTPSALFQVKGLDVARGLRFFGGHTTVYCEALQDFVGLYADGLPGVDAYLQENTDTHLAQACREAHAVGGAAAALGAVVLEQLAQEVETRLRGHTEHAEDAVPVLAGLRHELSSLVRALKARLEGV